MKVVAYRGQFSVCCNATGLSPDAENLMDAQFLHDLPPMARPLLILFPVKSSR